MKKNILIIIGVLYLCVYNLNAQTGVTKVGTTAGKFLSIEVGPRANAMGSAYVSIASDATAMYWNPAGITQINGFNASFTNAKWIADIAFNYAGAVLQLGDFGTIGVNATFVTMDPFERTTTDQPEGTGELVDAGCYAFGLSYARKLTDQFSIGFNAKFINERLYQSNAYGFAVDIGTMFDTQLEGIKLGMSISNYGTKMKLSGQAFLVQHDTYPGVSGNNEIINAELSTDAFDLPLTFRLGASVDILKGWANSNLILSIDALHPSDDVEYVNVGAEYVFNNLIALRIGYKGLFAKDLEQGLNLGGGIQYNLEGTNLQFDYSHISFGMLKSVNMFSLSIGL